MFALFVGSIIGVFWILCSMHDTKLKEEKESRIAAREILSQLSAKIIACNAKLPRTSESKVVLAREQFAQVLVTFNQAEAYLDGEPKKAKHTAQAGERQLAHVYTFWGDESQPEPEPEPGKAASVAP